MNIDRRSALKLGIGTAALSLLPKALRAAGGEASEPLQTRAIPSTGERLPVIGIGTDSYDHTPAEKRAGIKEVLRLFPEEGGKLVDMAESYGEPMVGQFVSELGNRDRLFLATKVGIRGKAEGRAQIERSFRRLRVARIDLIAVHNLVDADTQLATLRGIKEQGRIRYLGVTVWTREQHAELEATMKSQALDFIQVNFAINNREAGERILPLALDRGLAVMINVPFGAGRIFRAVQGKPLPAWAAEFDCRSWGQFFLKYIVSFSAVTCAIPGTTQARHLRDDMAAAHGRLPDAAMRRRMENYIETL